MHQREPTKRKDAKGLLKLDSDFIDSKKEECNGT